MNLEKAFEWGAIILVVILGARWLAGLFGTGDPVQPLNSTLPPGPAYWQGWPYGTGVVVMAPGIVGAQYPRHPRNRPRPGSAWTNN